MEVPMKITRVTTSSVEHIVEFTSDEVERVLSGAANLPYEEVKSIGFDSCSHDITLFLAKTDINKKILADHDTAKGD
jgi:hypothetical protein